MEEELLDHPYKPPRLTSGRPNASKDSKQNMHNHNSIRYDLGLPRPSGRGYNWPTNKCHFLEDQQFTRSFPRKGENGASNFLLKLKGNRESRYKGELGKKMKSGVYLVKRYNIIHQSKVNYYLQKGTKESRLIKFQKESYSEMMLLNGWVFCT